MWALGAVWHVGWMKSTKLKINIQTISELLNFYVFKEHCGAKKFWCNFTCYAEREAHFVWRTGPSRGKVLLAQGWGYVCKPCTYMDTCQANSSQHTLGSWNHVLIIITYIVTYLVLLLCLTISGCTKISWWQNFFTDVSIMFSKLSATINERLEGTVYLILHVYKVRIDTVL